MNLFDTAPSTPVRRRLFVAGAALVATAFALHGQPASAQADKVNLGVAIPAATHSFTAGIVFWANQAKKDLEKEYPGIKVTVRTARSSSTSSTRRPAAHGLSSMWDGSGSGGLASRSAAGR